MIIIKNIKNTKNIDFDRHPCFNGKVKGKYGRVHLPVAPKCNIQCNYCKRKFDCVNESRPGVTSKVLSPQQALEYIDMVLAKEPRITAAGIAGPGDPFANPEETLETMRLIRRKYPQMILCLSSNGMNLAPHVPEIADIGVSHVTVTINGVDPEITAKIYPWVSDGKIIYKGTTGSELLLGRQLKAVESLKKHNIIVKINSIAVTGINDHHIVEVAKTMKKIGADLFNCMAMLPNPGTKFENIVEKNKAEMEELRKQAEKHLPQMRHCRRCRADAVGLLGDDKTAEFSSCLAACAKKKPLEIVERAFVAVATMEGILVNQHLGEADRFQIWGKDGDDGYKLIEERTAPATGGGPKRWLAISRTLGDCRAILVSDLGPAPRKVLKEKGIRPIIMSGLIKNGLEAVYTGKGLSVLQGKIRKCSGKQIACGGDGTGCG